MKEFRIKKTKVNDDAFGSNYLYNKYYNQFGVFKSKYANVREKQFKAKNNLRRKKKKKKR